MHLLTKDCPLVLAAELPPIKKAFQKSRVKAQKHPLLLRFKLLFLIWASFLLNSSFILKSLESKYKLKLNSKTKKISPQSKLIQLVAS